RAFRELQSKQTTDKAFHELLVLASADPRARYFLAVHLPAMIEADPRDPRPDRRTLVSLQWCNAVQLAGAFKIEEAIPALAKWIAINTEPRLSTQSGDWALAGRPAGKALVEIGAPSVPTLQTLLSNPDKEKRWNAAYALMHIDTSKANVILRDYSARGTDRALGEYVRNEFRSEAPLPTK
ncbi:MAG: hypothetical protein P4L00_14080, partial [Candidatus Acidoferrales bacterium]|nr:hypothetical protein [Candidatus Acidoferrales bacterium]